MKRIYGYTIIFLVSMFVFPLISFAQCSNEREAELSKIASNVQFSYNYEMDEFSNPYFTIYVSNIIKDIYIGNLNDDNVIRNDYSFSYEGSGTTLPFIIYSNDPNCPNVEIMIKYLSLPTYNQFSTSEECEYYPESKYCQLWSNVGDLSQKQFNSEMEKYDNDEQISKKNRDDLIFTITQFFKENKILIIASVISLVSIPLLIILVRRTKK